MDEIRVPDTREELIEGIEGITGIWGLDFSGWNDNQLVKMWLHVKTFTSISR